MFLAVIKKVSTLIRFRFYTRPVQQDLPVLSFESAAELRDWLEENHRASAGIWVRIYKKNAGVASVTLEDVLDAGLCFGWSESKRVQGDRLSYLQQFAPRRTRGTTSQRNLEHARRLIEEQRMTPAGLRALGLQKAPPADGTDARKTAPGHRST